MGAFLIRSFELADQAGVEQLVLGIQQDEYGLALTAENQPDLKDVAQFFSAPGSAFWVAVSAADHEIIGCIGPEMIDGPVAVMRKFMVAPAWRGPSIGAAHALHQVFVGHAQGAGVRHLALSTVSATQRAQSFYRRMGWREVDRSALPPGCVPGVLDCVFMLMDA